MKWLVIICLAVQSQAYVFGSKTYDAWFEKWVGDMNDDYYPYIGLEDDGIHREKRFMDEFAQRVDKIAFHPHELPADLMVPCGQWHVDLFSGNDACCSKGRLCGRDEGDCDSDQECRGKLVCLNDNCPWESDHDDCCGLPQLSPFIQHLRGQK